MTQQPPRFGLRQQSVLCRRPTPESQSTALQRWVEFISQPIKTASQPSKGLLENHQIRVTDDRKGVLQTCGEWKNHGNWLTLEEAAYLLQRGLLTVENSSPEAIFGLLEARINSFALFSYIRRSGFIARNDGLGGYFVYSSAGFSKRNTENPLYRIQTVTPSDQLQLCTDQRQAVMDLGRVVRVLQVKVWLGNQGK